MECGLGSVSPEEIRGRWTTRLEGLPVVLPDASCTWVCTSLRGLPAFVGLVLRRDFLDGLLLSPMREGLVLIAPREELRLNAPTAWLRSMAIKASPTSLLDGLRDGIDNHGWKP